MLILKLKLRIMCLLVCLFLFVVNSVCLADTVTAKSAIVVDSVSGKICYSKDIHIRRLPASTTKLVTALVVLDSVSSFSKSFVVSKNASKVEPSKAYLSYNQSYFISQLLHAILMASSNDAAIVLAEGVCGDEKKFAELMNEKCRTLGLANTKFANASGLPSEEEQYTTVYDLVIIMNEVIKNPILFNMMKKKMKIISGSDGKKIKLINHNKLLWRELELVIGKTGYTRAAGQCFVGFKEVNSGDDVFFAMLGGKKLWGDIRKILGKSRIQELEDSNQK